MKQAQGLNLIQNEEELKEKDIVFLNPQPTCSPAYHQRHTTVCYRVLVSSPIDQWELEVAQAYPIYRILYMYMHTYIYCVASKIRTPL